LGLERREVKLSIIIPTLDEGPRPSRRRSRAAAPARLAGAEVIVVDGGEPRRLARARDAARRSGGSKGLAADRPR
jgi:hypothetical protein